MPAPISNLASSALNPQRENAFKLPEKKDIAVAPHLTCGAGLRLSGNWLNQQKARLTPSQQQLLNAALSALSGQDAVNDIRQDALGGQFNLARPSYDATSVHFQRDEQAPDTLGFIDVKDRQGNSLLTLGHEGSIASASEAREKLPSRADESSILANSRHDPKAAWQRAMYIVPFFTAYGEKARVVGDYMKGDNSRFEVKDSTGEAYATLKRTKLDSGEPVWMLPEHASVNGGAGGSSSSAGAKLIDAEHREKIARTVYEENVVYHATEKNSKRSIRKHGFKISKKRDGATARLTQEVMMQESFVRNAKNFNYVMRDKESAKNFNYFTKPTLVRTFAEGVYFEMDPDFKNGSALRTPQDISSNNVIGSKHSAPSEGESTVMKALMARAGVNVDTKEAGRLLREVQSDSEDDF
ncbi:hypothetical protein [Brenneria rubrifaciens]|uniref:Uncharacterized protein n=1 Tax=Brenneria rubrifaciens TaxID=55213 RepID=A0A4V1FA77_9GAMM|nr:hypothetical protein [Brenneria rubrifaciens]QCR10113.1 hypothetical protein EH207_17425 [Brenneria rubrifaciens]